MTSLRAAVVRTGRPTPYAKAPPDRWKPATAGAVMRIAAAAAQGSEITFIAAIAKRISVKFEMNRLGIISYTVVNA